MTSATAENEPDTQSRFPDSERGRICMVVQSTYPQDERVRREAEALERRGIEVDVVCQRAEGQDDEEAFGLVTAYRVAPDREKESLGKYMWSALSFAFTSFFAVQRLARKRDYALVQVHNMPDFLVFAGLLQKINGKPLVLDLHDLSVELFQSKWSGAKAALLLPLVKAAERASCGLADRLITASTGFRDLLIKRGMAPEKITLYLNTPDPRIFKEKANRTHRPIAEGARLLYHGTVARRFGLLKAIDAVALLQERVPGTTVHIYGKYDADHRRELEEKIRETGMGERVFLPGYRTLEQICEIIHESDIGVAPYESDVFTNLIIPTKLLEYAALGLPVVATRLEGIERVFDERCMKYMETGSAEDLADKIAELCLDPEARRRQAEHARAAIEEISAEVMAGRYCDLIESLI